MAIVLTETVESRTHVKSDNPSITFVYVLTGSSDDVAVKAFVESNTATVYESLARRVIEIAPEWVDTNTGQGLWNVEVRYGLLPLLSVGESSYAFDTTGGLVHITQSKASIRRVPGDAQNFEGAIGVTDDSVEGVDIQIPVFSFSETHFLPDVTITPTYKGIIAQLTGHTNNSFFKGLEIGECLFLGANGSKRGSSEWEITYNFAGSGNATINVGNLGGVSKQGWEYIWVRYKDKEDATSKSVVKVPLAAYVERVYDAADMSLLGIGT